MATVRSVVNGTTLTASITELNPYTNYDCYVTANTSISEGIPLQVVTKQTTISGRLIAICQLVFMLYIIQVVLACRHDSGKLLQVLLLM